MASKKGGVGKEIIQKGIEAEEDPAWRNWFLEVERRKKALHDPAKKPMLALTYEKDGTRLGIIRRKSEPIDLKHFLGRKGAKSILPFAIDQTTLKAAWAECVPEDIAASCEALAYKNGILTVAVKSAPLLQEIRQFRQSEIYQTACARWPFPSPLVRILYKLGVS